MSSFVPFAFLALFGGQAFAAVPVAAFLEGHCIECHDAEMKKGGLDLSGLAFDKLDAGSLKAWQRIYERVRDGEMPPKKKPQPEVKERDLFLAALKEPLLEGDRADMAANGRVRSRRLTRVEYEHTLHDLLGIDIPLKTLLPEDRATHGFETVADGQQLSHHQLASYLDVADLALSDAFRRAAEGDKDYQRHHTPKQMAVHRGGNNRMPEHRGGRTISWPITLQFFGRLPATTVPEDGWYRMTLRGVQAINPGPDGAVWGTLRSGACASSAPMLYMIGLVEATAEPRDFSYEAWIQGGHMLEMRPNDATQRKAATGGKGGNVSFVGRDLEKQGYQGIAFTGIDMERIHPNAGSATVKRRLFGEVDLEKASPEELDALIARFATRAFRRPANQEQTAPYRQIAAKCLGEGDSAAEALRAAYRAILCSPRFLTFIEAPGPLDDHALAARLSYALWCSMPDRDLTQLANQKKLHDPAVLAQQVERMLADEKAKRFIASFTDQWLKLKEIDFTTPDTRLFRDFDPVVQESMLQETRSYFTELLRGDLSITHLIDSDFAFLNGRLARHYAGSSAPKAAQGKPKKVKAPAAAAVSEHPMISALKPGEGFQKVALKPEAKRGGLVTQGAILKVTADGTSTSPVVRGVFINERILGNHIPPPPPGVPAIEPDIRGATSIRDQLDKHRNNESCASCHQTIDPPGFALENYDPVGIWRPGYGKDGRGVKVDPSGLTPEGETFTDLASWQEIYTQQPQQLARGFASHFLTYATGAAPRFSDEATLDGIAKKATSVRSIIREVVLSDIFQTK